MQIGSIAIFQRRGYDESVTDAQVYEEELRLALQLEELGYDALWSVEHHFEDYSFCPDNTVLLAYVAARTRRLKLATGAVILPWNDPLRVAEKISLLDQLSGGRVIFGMGRGLSRREYGQFGIDMDTSRDRFDEASRMILDALETGVIRGDGPYYPQPEAKIRPKPTRSFVGRTTSVAMSPDSVEQAARLGVQMMVFNQKPIEEHEAEFEAYREAFRRQHGRAAPPPVITDFCVCHEDAERAEELARKHIAGYLLTVMHHYELMGEHFKRLKGYEAYGSAVDTLREVGLEGMAEGYLAAQSWGTPEQILEKLAARREVVGDFDLLLAFRCSGIPIEDAEHSMRLFAEKVMPQLRRG